MTDKPLELELLPGISVRCRLPVVIGISGITCSGKTELTGRIEKHLLGRGIKAAVIRMDDHFRDIDDPVFIKEGGRKVNFEIPEAYHKDEIIDHARSLYEGRPVRSYIYDTPSNRRTEEYRLIEPSSVILVDGLYAIMFLRGELDNFRGIYADAEFGICLERRIARDTALLGVSEDQVVALMKNRVIPTLDPYMYPQRSVADLLIDTRKEVIRDG